MGFIATVIGIGYLALTLFDIAVALFFGEGL